MKDVVVYNEAGRYVHRGDASLRVLASTSTRLLRLVLETDTRMTRFYVTTSLARCMRQGYSALRGDRPRIEAVLQGRFEGSYSVWTVLMPPHAAALCAREDLRDEFYQIPPAAAALITSARFCGAGGLGDKASASLPADMISLTSLDLGSEAVREFGGCFAVAIDRSEVLFPIDWLPASVAANVKS